MTRRGWILFAAMGAIWGVPYLFIRVAVRDLAPPVVVFGRSSLAAIALGLVARQRGALLPALRKWRPVLAFAVLEMGIPWILLTNAEQHLPSGLTALIVAAVPIAGAIVAFLLGERSALRPVRVAGIVCGLGGVALLVGRDLTGKSPPPVWSVIEVLVVVVCYATAPFIPARKLADVPSIGVIAVSLGAVATVYLPLAIVARPTHAPHVRPVLAVLGLAVICTGIAFVVFFELITEAGPTRAGLVPFANPVVAVALGALLLHEQVTIATFVGFVLVLAGCFFATRPVRAVDDSAGVVTLAPDAAPS